MDASLNEDIRSEHVHKVIEPGTTLGAFRFDDSEWKRKAETALVL